MQTDTRAAEPASERSVIDAITARDQNTRGDQTKDADTDRKFALRVFAREQIGKQHDQRRDSDDEERDDALPIGLRVRIRKHRYLITAARSA